MTLNIACDNHKPPANERCPPTGDQVGYSASNTGGVPVKYFLFVDESGDFASPGTHIIAGLGCAGEYAEADSQAEAIFLNNGLDYRNFHTTDCPIEKRGLLWQALATNVPQMECQFARITLNRKADCDIYFAANTGASHGHWSDSANIKKSK